MKALDDLTSHCIRCGFCIEACPTFLETGSELESPRGRIYLVRSVDEGKLTWQDIKPHLDRCLGCRSCETSCPSGVEYGAILEIARNRMEKESPEPAKNFLLKTTTNPTLLKTQLALGKLLPGSRVPNFLSKALSGQLPEANRPVPQKPAKFPDLPKVEHKGEVFLLEGCAMRVLYPRVHQATRRLLARIGYTVREVSQGCCGALHAHNGHLDDARKMGENLIEQLKGELPVVINSAGCGSTIKEYGHLLDSAEGQAFASRTFDLSEFLLNHGFLDVLAAAPPSNLKVTYHDACHLAHGQKITQPPRKLIQAIPGVEYVELEEADLCCGSAGIYNVTQPEMARKLVERKMNNAENTGAHVVALGNPGCHAWIRQAAEERGGRVKVMHTAELLEASFVGLELFD